MKDKKGITKIDNNLNNLKTKSGILFHQKQ